MKKNIIYTNLNDAYRGSSNLNIDLVDTCPHCSCSSDPVALNACLGNCGNVDLLSIHCYCCNCRNTFIAVYIYHNSYSHTFVRTYPSTVQTVNISSNINDLYPNFCKIYVQASSAEDEGLIEISGVGYRKALEFLIKDYAIAKNPNDADSISKKDLGKCIDEYIDNKHIKTLAKASAWLGNDETHYVRKHESYNIQDLKGFIRALLSFIDSEIETEKALQLLSTPKT
ncbi:MAG: hypothetical protein ACK5L6_03780 [Anaerorhabdus sp.]|uniref:hypothetical protein n=1 Tax=Anaerorhabdus sp. TaxID=1872524 RepID=UPI003A88F461